MAEPKTKVTNKDVAAFIDAVELVSKREEGWLLDAIFRRATREAPRLCGPSIIGYGEYRTTYSSGRRVHWMRAGFSPRKARHSLYLMGGYCDETAARRREPLLGRLGRHSTGKSCLYVNRLADVDLSALDELIEADC